MSALTERKKREIETQYREMMAKRGYRVFLTVFCDVKSLEDTFTIPQKIMDSIRKMKGVESVSYTDASNVITVMAQWKESEVNSKIREIQEIPKVVNVTAKILRPLF
ncbi:MAG TPA: hypothetical protein VKA95_17690 [Nitrososphaeraceae archaeon]|nr:hypothetical protein [Nitrososphaeraceae archaeon]